jgi:hypothetical protein
MIEMTTRRVVPVEIRERLGRIIAAREIASERRALEWVLSMREKLTLDVLQTIERRLEELEHAG